MTKAIRPPAHVEPYVNILGEKKALDFFFAFGGAPLYIPVKVKRNSPLVSTLGLESATKLIGAGARLPTRVPMPKPYIARVLYQQGLTVNELARKLHVTDTTIYEYLKDGPKRAPPDDQPDLFD